MSLAVYSMQREKYSCCPAIPSLVVWILDIPATLDWNFSNADRFFAKTGNNVRVKGIISQVTSG
jgi:hypothetical protein